MTEIVALKREINQAGKEQLSELCNMLGQSSKAETINTAIVLLKWAAKAVQDGYDIGYVNPTNDEVVVLSMKFIDHIRGKKNGRAQN